MQHGRRRSFLNNLPFAVKLGSIVLILLSCLGAIAYLSFDTTSKSLAISATYNSIAKQSKILTEQLEDILEARIAVMVWTAEPSERAIEAVDDNIADVVQSGERFISLPDVPEEKKELGRRIVDATTRYGAQFDEVRKLQVKRNELVETLDTIGPRIAENLDKIMVSAYEDADVEAAFRAGDASRSAGLVRLAGQKFLLRNQREDIDQFIRMNDETFQKLDLLVSELQNPTRRSLAADVRRDLGQYRETFEAVSQVIDERNPILDELIGLDPGQLEVLETTLDSQLERQEVLLAQSQELTASNQQRTLISLAVALAFAAISTFVLVRVTNKPLVKLVSRLEAVAEGHTNFHVRADNGTDEIGRMWDALSKLRAAAETAFARAQMIEQLTAPVLLADPKQNLALVYANDSAKSALKVVDGDTVSVGNLVGLTADEQKQMRDAAQLPLRTRCELPGGECLEVTVSAVTNEEGVYTAAMVSWREITKEVRGAASFETNVKATIDQISSTFGTMREEIEGIADRLGGTREQLAEGSSAVHGTTQNVQMVASAAEQLSASITEIATQLTSAADRAGVAASTTDAVSKQAEELAEVSNEITRVIESISDITNKTKLLALNATIEAASAGDAGKGFAVVAAEVKSLAEQTAESTKEIDTQIKAVQQRISTVVRGVVDVSGTIKSLSDVFASAAAAADEQQAATREITENAQHAAGGAEAAAKIINAVESASNSDAEATKSLTQDARELAKANDNLSQQSTTFLELMRAA
ncbi:MAG: methyl-accepting chemotaxis protein [Pseudomonadota bacterium]